MGFSEAIKRFFKGYVTFNGRASRSEFWYAQLLIVLMSLFFAILGDLTDLDLIIFLDIIVVFPLITLTARRLHDVNKSGWWQLLALTIIGLVFLIYWYCKAGDPSDNAYGLASLPEPK